MEKISFHFIIVVWGDEYVDMLLQVALRCFLSPKNIPALKNRNNSKFVFVTTQDDYQKISNSKIFHTLEKHIDITFLELDMSGDENKYSRMTKGYNLATEFACKENACAVYLVPDCLVSDGTFLSLEKYAQEGKEVVLLPGAMVVKEKVYDHIKTMRLAADQPLSFAPRELARWGLMDILHPEFQHYNYSKDRFTTLPHMVAWNIPGDDGLLIRAFHLHPLMASFVDRKEAVSFDADSIDEGFIERNFFDLNKFILERDSDNMIIYSMKDANYEHGTGSILLSGKRKKLKAIANIAGNAMVNNLHKLYFYNSYKLHSGDLGPAWFEVEKETFSVVGEAYRAPPNKDNKIYFLCWRYVRKMVAKMLPLRAKIFLKGIYWQLR